MSVGDVGMSACGPLHLCHCETAHCFSNNSLVQLQFAEVPWPAAAAGGGLFAVVAFCGASDSFGEGGGVVRVAAVPP